MVTNDKIETFIIEHGLPFEQVQDGLWLIHDEVDHIDNIVVYHTPPVLTFRVKLMEAPEKATRDVLFKRLLELNATSMVAGAYGLEDDAVVIVDTLQSENLDHNEFQATIDALAIAVREHYEELRAIVGESRPAAEASSQV
ncbi:YbjN domain-containing protein [Lujinxingia litoralis]|nr:YbjN domain-containing protein [Lujinxingia litoralis]